MVLNVTSKYPPVRNYKKQDIVNWVNKILQIKISKVENLYTGVEYCQMTNILYPGCINMQKVKTEPTLERECVHNFKLLQAALVRKNVNKQFPVEKVVQGKLLHNLEFARWFMVFFLDNCGDHRFDPEAVQCFYAPVNGPKEVPESKAASERCTKSENSMDKQSDKRDHPTNSLDIFKKSKAAGGVVCRSIGCGSSTFHKVTMLDKPARISHSANNDVLQKIQGQVKNRDRPPDEQKRPMTLANSKLQQRQKLLTEAMDCSDGLATTVEGTYSEEMKMADEKRPIGKNDPPPRGRRPVKILKVPRENKFTQTQYVLVRSCSSLAADLDRPGSLENSDDVEERMFGPLASLGPMPTIEEYHELQDVRTKNRHLINQNSTLHLERCFLFSKLRNIEIVCVNQQNLLNPLVKHIKAILYKSEMFYRCNV